MQPGNRLKIDVVTETFLPEVNGVTKSLDRMIRGIEAKGHDVSIFRPMQPEDGAGPIDLTLDSISGIRANPQEMFRWLRPKKRLQKEKEHHLAVPLRMPFYKEVQVGLASPHFFRGRFRKNRPDLVHIVTEGPLGLMALIAARSMGIPTISDYRTHFHQYFAYYGMAPLGRWVHRYLRTFHNFTRRTLVPTRMMKQELAESGFKRISVVGRGVDTEMYSPSLRSGELRESFGATGDTPVILYAGRLAPEKNIDLAIQSFRKIQQSRPDARMVLVGDGPERARLQAQNGDLHFTGFISGEDLARHYASSDVFLFPSQTDTFGNVVTEAAASGLAVVAYDRGAAREVLDDGHSAALALDDSPEAFMDACARVVAASGSVIAMGRAARVAACEVNWGSIADMLEEIYYGSLVRKLRLRNRIQWRMRKTQLT
jgi:glycosyltransferase involved in cell wall biosynthesis